MRALCVYLLASCGAPPSAAPVLTPPQEPTTRDTRAPSIVNPDDSAPASARADETSPAALSEPVFQHTHRQAIVDVAFSPDGRTVASISSEGTVALTNVATGATVASQRAWVRSSADRRVLWTPSGHKLVVASGPSFTETGGFRVWDMRSGSWTQVGEPMTLIETRHVTMHPDGARLFYVNRRPADTGLEPYAVLERFAGERESVTLPLPSLEATLSGSGRFVVAFLENGGALEITEAGEPARAREVALDPPASVVAHRPGGGAIAVLDMDGGVTLLDPLGSREPLRLPIEDARWLSWSPNASHLVVFKATEATRFDLHAQVTGRFAWPEGIAAEQAAIAHDAEHVYVVAPEGLLRLDPSGASGELVVPGQLAPGVLDVARDGTVAAVVDDLDLLLVGRDGTIRSRTSGGSGEHSVWGLRWAPSSRSLTTFGRGGIEQWGTDGATVSTCGEMGPIVHGGEQAFIVRGPASCDVRSGSIEELGGTLITQSDDGALLLDRETEYEVRSVRDSRAIRIRKPPGMRERCMAGPCVLLHALDAHGTAVAFARTDALAGQLHVYALAGGRARETGRVRPPTRHSRPINLALGPRGDVLAVRWQHENAWEVTLHATRGGRLLAQFPADTREHTTPFLFSPDGSSIALLGAPIRIVGVPSGIEASVASVDEPPESLAFSGDGSTLVARFAGRLVTFGLDGVRRIELRARAQIAVHPSAESFAYCEAGALVIFDPVADRRTRLGVCTAEDEPSFSPDGQLLALRRGAYVEVYRPGTPDTITLRTPRLREGLALTSFPVAYDRRGRFQIPVGAGAHFLWREGGPLTAASLGPLPSDRATPDLVSSFFAR